MNYLEHYHKEGFCLAPKGISKHHLKLLCLMADELEADAVSGDCQYVLPEQAMLEDIAGQQMAFRINDVYRTHYELLLEVMSSSPVLDAVVSIAGLNAIPLSADLQFKNPGSENIIEWHQDCIFDRQHPYFALGIYLDDVGVDDGCMRYVAQSQTQKQDVNKLASQYGWNIPKNIQMPVSKASILIHDGMILHGSSPKIDKGRRRTLYIEFSPWQPVLEKGPQSEDWVNLRRKWMQLVFNKSGKYQPTSSCLEMISDIQQTDQLFKKIYAKREPALPSVWATTKIVRDDYPALKSS